MSTYKYPTTGKSSPKHNRSDSGVGSASDYDTSGYDASYDQFDNTPSIRDVLRSKQVELDRLKAELTALQAEHKIYLHENKELQSGAKAHGAEIKGLQTENKELQSNNKDLQTANKELQSATKELRREIRDMEKGYHEICEDKEKLKREGDRLRKQRDELSDEHKKLTAENLKLSSDNEKLTDKNQKLKNVIDQYNAYLDTIDPERPVPAIRSSSEPSSPKAAKTQTVKFDKSINDKEADRTNHAERERERGHRGKDDEKQRGRLSKRFEIKDDKSESSDHSARSADAYIGPVSNASAPSNQASASARRQRRPSVVAASTTVPQYIATSGTYAPAHEPAYQVPRTPVIVSPASSGMKRRQSVSYVQNETGNYVPFDLPGQRRR